MTKRLKLATLLLSLFVSTSALAQLEPWKDYDISKELWNVTMVKVHPNMGDDYLEGLRETWVASNRVAKELGQIEDFFIYTSEVGASGDANVLLVVKFSDSSQLEPSKERYDAFMKAWGEANQDKTREISKNYPSMREITGEYLLRRIDIK
ncbi:MAG: hypothetical protein ACSLE2_13185 [Lysobacterales bacterium]